MHIDDNGNEIVVTGISNESQYEHIACPANAIGCELVSEEYMTKAIITGTEDQMDKYREAIS